MWYSYRELIYRVGSFFIMLGLFLIMLFIVSDTAGRVMFSYFCWGLVFLIIGIAFRNQYKKAFEDNKRFSLFKKLFSKKPK